MRLQSTQFSCGPVAIMNAFKAANITCPPEDTVSELAGTTAVKGTSPAKMKRGLKRLGVYALELRTQSPEWGWVALTGALELGRPVILLVDDDEHWVAAVGLLGGRVLVADGADGELVASMDLESLMKRWYSGECYAISICGVIST